MGREVSVAPGEYKFAAYLVEPSRGSCRDAGSKSRRPRTNVTLGRWATLRRCSAFWFTIAALVVGYFIYLRTVSAWLAVSPLLFAVAASIGQARFRRGTAQQ